MLCIWEVKYFDSYNNIIDTRKLSSPKAALRHRVGYRNTIRIEAKNLISNELIEWKYNYKGRFNRQIILGN